MLDEIDRKKLRVFQVILVFTAVSGILFATINYHRGLQLLATIEWVVALISAWLLFRVIGNQSAENFKRLALIYVIMFYSIMMLAFSMPGVSISIFAWALVIPLAAYLLLGVKQGFWVTAIYYSVTLVIFFSGFSDHQVMQEGVAYANLIICALLFWGVSHSYERSNALAKKKLQKMAMYDHLTDLYNRSMMYDLFERVQHNAAESGRQLAVVLYDLDRFKNINDSHGHAAGDEVLRQFAQILKSQCQTTDVSFRLGGEEFAVFMQAADDEGIHQRAESIRKATEKIHVDGVFSQGTITVSAGVAIDDNGQNELSVLLQQADTFLYSAKSGGRNQVVKQLMNVAASVP